MKSRKSTCISNNEITMLIQMIVVFLSKEENRNEIIHKRWIITTRVSAMEKRNTAQLECVTENHHQIQTLGGLPWGGDPWLETWRTHQGKGGRETRANRAKNVAHDFLFGEKEMACAGGKTDVPVQWWPVSSLEVKGRIQNGVNAQWVFNNVNLEIPLLANSGKTVN